MQVIETGDASSFRRGERGDYTPDEVRAMQRTVPRILHKWGATDAEAALILGGLSPKTLRRWGQGQYGRVNRDLADRMSYILGIHKALRIVFADAVTGHEWMQRPNAAFDGATPLQLLMQGGMDDLRRLRRYLDSVRGGW